MLVLGLAPNAVLDFFHFPVITIVCASVIIVRAARKSNSVDYVRVISLTELRATPQGLKNL